MFCRLTSLALLFFAFPAAAAEWSIAVGGNAFRTSGSASDGVRRDGALAWSGVKDAFAIFFRVDRPAELDLALDARAANGDAALSARVGEKNLKTKLRGGAFASHKLGRVSVAHAGYVRVELQGTERGGADFGEIRALVVASETADLKLDFVKSNDGNMFYWGRRGPSVHLTYRTPAGAKLKYAYSEITVPKGQDAVGSYFMANGFGEGYFGMQVNSPKERRVLFSVWSPFRTDDPKSIPADQRVVTQARGPGVRIGEFGNEGSGGQSFLVYPWKAGATYRFLTEIEPDGPANTRYTSWFGEKSTNEWRLVASFQRPKTQTYLRGFHSFLENFNPATGHIGRLGEYGNVWVRDTDGRWHECTEATFSTDATGRGRHRLDFAGGADGERFFLRNCGFFDDTGKPGATFKRKPTAGGPPDVDFGKLPRS